MGKGFYIILGSFNSLKMANKWDSLYISKLTLTGESPCLNSLTIRVHSEIWDFCEN